MSNVIVRGWDWLEAELHKALAIAHLTNVPSEAPLAAKAAVSAVLEAAKADALAHVAQLGADVAELAINGAVSGLVDAVDVVVDLLDGSEPDAPAATDTPAADVEE